MAEAVPFIREQYVVHRNIALSQRFDDLFRFMDWHIGVVSAVQHQRRRLDSIQLVNGRECVQQSPSVSGSPYSTFEMLAIQGSVSAKKVLKLTTP